MTSCPCCNPNDAGWTHSPDGCKNTPPEPETNADALWPFRAWIEGEVREAMRQHVFDNHPSPTQYEKRDTFTKPPPLEPTGYTVMQGGGPPARPRSEEGSLVDHLTARLQEAWRQVNLGTAATVALETANSELRTEVTETRERLEYWQGVVGRREARAGICPGHASTPLPAGRSCWACTAEDFEQRLDDRARKANNPLCTAEVCVLCREQQMRDDLNDHVSTCMLGTCDCTCHDCRCPEEKR